MFDYLSYSSVPTDESRRTTGTGNPVTAQVSKVRTMRFPVLKTGLAAVAATALTLALTPQAFAATDINFSCQADTPLGPQAGSLTPTGDATGTATGAPRGARHV